jgi:hypothetical protein
MATRDEALAALITLNTAPIFVESYRARQLPENLEIYFGPPEEFFLAGESQSPYVKGGLIPILDDGNFGVVTFLDPKTRSLIQKDVEAPHEALARFENWQQYLGDLTIRIAESVDDNDRLSAICKLIDFRYLTETLAFLDSNNEASFEEFNTKRASFLASIPA